MINLKITYKRLLTGDARMSPNEVNFINLTIDNILRKKYIDSCELEDVTNIIKISNLLYNNGANAALPLSDAKYDALLVLCRKQQIPYPVGAPPVKLFNVEEVSRLEPSSGGLKEVMSVVRDKDDMLFFQNIVDDTVSNDEYIIISYNNFNEKNIKRIKKIEYKNNKRANLLKNEIETSIDEMGESMSNEEMRQVLLEIVYTMS